MLFIIDGHNLIPKIPGLSLEEIDDEQHLIELLLEYCQRSQDKVEVYFDRSPVGQMRVRSFGNVVAHFVRIGQTADQAIAAYLRRQGGKAQNCTVVSSDRSVQTSARAARAKVSSSPEFARRIRNTLDAPPRSSVDRSDIPLEADEVDEWMKLFSAGEEKKSKPTQKL